MQSLASSPTAASPDRRLSTRGMLPGVILCVLAAAVFTLSPWLGVPVVGQLLGRDSDFAIMSLALLDAAWTEGLLWPRWLMDSNNVLGAARVVTDPPVG